jgi:putative transposase
MVMSPCPFQPSIARHVNDINQTKGHVWGDRYKSILIEDGPGLLACMAYVELNPVRAKMVESPAEYRWCSLGRFRQGGAVEAGVVVPPMPDYPFLETPRRRQLGFALLVEHFASREQGKESSLPTEIAEFQQMIDTLDKDSLADMLFRRTHWIKSSLILGSKAFAERCILQYRLQSGRFREPMAHLIGLNLFNGRRRGDPIN